MKARPQIEIVLKGRNELLECFLHHGSFSGLFVPGHVHLPVGQEVVVDVRVNEEDVTFHVKGSVHWKRVTASDKLPAGLGIAFLSSETRTRDLILHFAQGRIVKLIQRRSKRVPVSIEITYKTPSAFLTDFTEDISRDGAFIATNNVIPIGTPLTVKLKPPGQFLAIRLDAEVRWRQDGDRPGIGVEFIFGNSRMKNRIAKLIQEIEAQVAADFELG